MGIRVGPTSTASRKLSSDRSLIGYQDERLHQRCAAKERVLIGNNASRSVEPGSSRIGNGETAGAYAQPAGVMNSHPPDIILGQEEWLAGKKRNPPRIFHVHSPIDCATSPCVRFDLPLGPLVYVMWRDANSSLQRTVSGNEVENGC
jgi:hypothetical protein